MLYQLKKDYGVYGQLFMVAAYDPNYATGRANRTVNHINIEQIIQLGRNVSFDALVQSLKLSTPDALQQNTEAFLFDCDDLPNGWTVSPKDYIIIGGKQYDISWVNLIDSMGAIHVRATQHAGKLDSIISAAGVTRLELEGATYSE